MPLPLIAIGGGAVSGLLRVAGLAFLVDVIKGAVEEFMRSESGAAFVTDIVNAKIAGHGIDFRFANILNRDSVTTDLFRFVTERVNGKMGTDFANLNNLTRDDALEGVGRVIAARINTDSGANLATVYPVARFRQELGTELLRQFTSADLSPGALFPQNRVTQLKEEFAKTMKASAPYPTANESAKAANNRKRQAKYRKSHKRVWQ